MIAPYTPHYNGILERKNISIFNMARSMLKAKKIPKHLWGEAILIVVYIINICLTNKLNNKTPHETWSGLNPSVGHLKIFGTSCFRQVHEKLIRKLDDRNQVMVMIGYHSTWAYKLFSPTKNKVVISRDVEFDESKGWNLLKIPENPVQEGESSSHVRTTLHSKQHVAPVELSQTK